ncbi:MAG: type II toxin-antitoxin system RelE/ParE family toxin [Candidatus Aenigmarchaeota archaeon]|nr:type II toxin-antitoxin system RelE/ParE family toxin [Candidatus Aenigmarchaeota archaeon]
MGHVIPNALCFICCLKAAVFKAFKIREILEYLKLDPVPAKVYDLKKLEGSKDSFRIRIGKMRILYTIIWKDKVILVSRIEKRGTVYD